jgi:hypothetical protein
VVDGMGKRATLSRSMTEAQFDNGYWYDKDLRAFAAKLGIPGATRLRKDELEKAIKHFLRTGEVKNLVRRALTKSGDRDLDKGLRMDLPIVHYTSNRETKDFIEREALKLDPTFRKKSGTRYLLNRWREEQIARGKRITYGDLVRQFIVLNRTKTGPLRIEHGRYMNFISDFMAAHEEATHEAAVRAWHEVKAMDAPKTYAAWAEHRPRRKPPRKA